MKPNNINRQKLKTILLWILAGFFGVGGLMYLPHPCSFLMLLAAVFVAPIVPWQKMIDSVFADKRGFKAAAAVILCLIALLAAPTQSTEPQISAPGATQDSMAAPIESQTQATTGNPTEESQLPGETALPEESAETQDPSVPSVNPADPAAKPTKPQVPADSKFEVHFIDVGQADSALILCDGKAMLIDGGNAPDSNIIYTYLEKHNVNYLDYIVCSHAHEDHVGGLSGALNYAKVGVAFAPVTEYNSRAFKNFVSNLDKQGISITVPKTNDTFMLGSAKCTVLSCKPKTGSVSTNNTSIVIRIEYGETSFLFTGDAEREVEKELVDRGAPLKSAVLKVGHHGSDTSSTYPFINAVMPEYAVISCGKGNSYGHPKDSVLSRFRDADTKLFRTDLQGDIICVSDGKKVTMKPSRNPDADVFGGIGPNSTQKPEPPKPTNPKPTEPKPTQPQQQEIGECDYVVNIKTGKYHCPTCAHAKKINGENRLEFHGTKAELDAKGYTPCKTCKP